MRYVRIVAAFTATVVLMSGWVGAVSEPDPLKWSQPVDINTGWAVPSYGYTAVDNQTQVFVAPNVVADDWLCLTGLPVTDFHWWGAYTQGNPGSVQAFEISIHEDVPAGDNIPSHPGPLLWARIVPANEVNETFYATGPGAAAPGPDIYQYNVWFDDPQDYFYQEQGQIYWMNVIAAMPDNESVWGWQTAVRPGALGGLDAAVSIGDYDIATGIYTQWTAMIDDLGPVQMAFELTTVPEPATLAIVGTAGLMLVGLIRRRKMS